MLHGISFGLAIDMACCADIRLCSEDVKLSVKEVDIGLAADIGTLSRLPKAVSSLSWVKDVCLSARVFGAHEALARGFVSRVHASKADAVAAALQTAALLASKSPVAVQGTKELLNHARDSTVAESKPWLPGGAACLAAGLTRNRPPLHRRVEFCHGAVGRSPRRPHVGPDQVEAEIREAVGGKIREARGSFGVAPMAPRPFMLSKARQVRGASDLRLAAARALIRPLHWAVRHAANTVLL